MSSIEVDKILKKGPGAFRELIEAAKAIDHSGVPITFVHSGEPNFDTPAHIKQAAIEAMNAGYTHYVPNIGLPGLRTAIAEKLSQENRIEADPGSEIIVTNGAALGLWLALMVIVSKGDEVLVLNPSFSSFVDMIGLAGGRPILASKIKQAGRFDLDKTAIAEKITSRTRAIMINTPNNPTGSVYRRIELEMIADIAREHDLFIIADEAYEKLIYDQHTHLSIASLAPEIRERTITVYSFSKTYAMTGWRLGYVVANHTLTKAMSHLYQNSARCATAFVQMAGIAALQASETAVRKMLNEYASRRVLAVSGLNAIAGLSCFAPEGTFYVFPDISALGVTSWEFVVHLLFKEQVLALPGSVFGSQGEGHMRLSFSRPRDEIERAIAAIERAVNEFKDRPLSLFTPE